MGMRPTCLAYLKATLVPLGGVKLEEIKMPSLSGLESVIL